MAVKMLTTKKHTKTAKVINQIKEINKPIEVVKAKKEPKRKTKRPMLKLGQTITLQEYIDAQLIVKQYEKENPKPIFINLYDKLPTRVANGVHHYFKTNKKKVDIANMDERMMKDINLSKIKVQRNFGKLCMIKLTQYLDKLK